MRESAGAHASARRAYKPAEDTPNRIFQARPGKQIREPRPCNTKKTGHATTPRAVRHRVTIASEPAGSRTRRAAVTKSGQRPIANNDGRETKIPACSLGGHGARGGRRPALLGGRTKHQRWWDAGEDRKDARGGDHAAAGVPIARRYQSHPRDGSRPAHQSRGLHGHTLFGFVGGRPPANRSVCGRGTVSSGPAEG